MGKLIRNMVSIRKGNGVISKSKHKLELCNPHTTYIAIHNLMMDGTFLHNASKFASHSSSSVFGSALTSAF